MPELIAGIETLGPVAWLRSSAWGYALVNGLHILGIAMLVGSIINVDLRMIGLWRGDRWREAMRESLPVARVGFTLAVMTGLMLASVQLKRYLDNPAFLLKMSVLVVALTNVVLFYQMFYNDPKTPAMRVAGCVSLGCWLTILGAGRAIGFL